MTGSAFDSLWTSTGLQAIARIFTESITLQRADTTTEGVPAQRWDTEYESRTRDGVVTVTRARLWLIDIANYTVGGEEVKPRRGDRITDASGGRWEVLPANDRPEVERQEPAQWIIRTKRVDRA